MVCVLESCEKVWEKCQKYWKFGKFLEREKVRTFVATTTYT